MAGLRFHPIYVERPLGGQLSVRWYTAAGGECCGRTFYDDNPMSQTSLMAQARTLAQVGHIRHEAGHYCEKAFPLVFEFTQRKYRFFAFRDRDVFYITNGAWKETVEKKQDRDRRFCENCRIEYFCGEESQ